jgi:hypothetical protein
MSARGHSRTPETRKSTHVWRRICYSQPTCRPASACRPPRYVLWRRERVRSACARDSFVSLGTSQPIDDWFFLIVLERCPRGAPFSSQHGTGGPTRLCRCTCLAGPVEGLGLLFARVHTSISTWGVNIEHISVRTAQLEHASMSSGTGCVNRFRMSE